MNLCSSYSSLKSVPSVAIAMESDMAKVDVLVVLRPMDENTCSLAFSILIVPKLMLCLWHGLQDLDR